MNLFRLSILIVLCLMILDTSTIAYPDTSNLKIKEVVAICSFPDPVHASVQNKIRSSLAQTLESILMGDDAKSIDNYINAQDEIESRIVEGLNIVFEPKGYRIESLELKFDEKTEAAFVVKPFGASVTDVLIQIDTRSFHPFWADRFNSTLEKKWLYNIL